MKKMLIFVMFVILGLSTYSFEILGVKSGMTKEKVEKKLETYIKKEGKNKYIWWVHPFYDERDIFYKIIFATRGRESVGNDSFEVLPTLFKKKYGVLNEDIEVFKSRDEGAIWRITLVDKALKEEFKQRTISKTEKEGLEW